MHQSLMPQQLFPSQPQHPQQPSQHNLNLLQNSPGANPGLAIMGGQPGPSNPNYAMSMQPGARRLYMQPPQPNGSGLQPGGAGGPPHMPNLTPNQMQSLQVQGMSGNMNGNMTGFPGAGMISSQQAATLRRVQSQPLGQPGAHMGGGMQPTMMGGGMPGMPGPPQVNGLRMHPNMQMRQQQPQQHGQGGGAMSPEMGLTMRPGSLVGAGQLQPHTRTGSGSQMMPTLTQPANLGQGHGMQHNFGGPMSLSHQHPHQHQASQMGSSTHVGPSGQQPPNMGAQPGGNRAQMVTPENNMFMNFQTPPIQPPLSHGVPRIPLDNMSNPPFNMAPSSSPINAGGDMPQRGNGPMNASGPMTPAQVLHMNTSGDAFPANSYGMGQPPISGPPRPPSHNGPHNGFAMTPSQSQPSLTRQQSPRQPDHLSNQMLQRPQSQPQVGHRSSPIPPPGRVRTPRGSQPSLPMNTSSMLPPTRVPTAAAQSPSHPPAQPPASAPPSAHPAQIAPRPASVTPVAPALTRSSSTAPSAGQQSTAAESSQPPRASAPPAAPAPGSSAPSALAPAVQPAPAQIPRK